MRAANVGGNYAYLGQVAGALLEPNLAIKGLRKAWEGGFKDAAWLQRDPDLTSLRGEPEFERCCSENGISGSRLTASYPLHSSSAITPNDLGWWTET